MKGRDDVLVALAALPCVAVLILRESQIAGGVGFPLDDAWIHLHFARNLAEGRGFVYNDGVPVAGSTAPLWTLLLASGALIVGPSLALAKGLGVAASVAAAVVTRRATAALGADRITALMAGAALAWMAPMAWGALSGMEVSLAAVLVAAAVLANAQDRTIATAVLGALAVLARPEALLLVPLLAVARPLTWRRILIFVGVTAAVLAPAVAFTLATVGAPVPATAAAKVEGGLLGWLSGIREPATRTWLGRPAEFLREWLVWLLRIHWLLPLAILTGAAAAARGRHRHLAVLALAIVAHPLGMALLAPYRGPAFQEGRYSIHLLPLTAMLAATAVGTLPAAWRRAATAAWLGLAIVGWPSAAERYAWGVQNINAMQVHLGRWVDANLPPAARLAVNDVGAIAYFSRREVIDLMGLVTPEIIPFRREGERGVIRYVEITCPDYVIIFPTWFPQLARREELTPIYRVVLPRNEVAGGPEMVVYRLTRCAV